MQITITGTVQHLHALRNACELYLRIGLGQFAEVAEQHIGRLWEESKGEGIGSFTDPEQAHAAYVAASKEHFGDFACSG